MNAVKGLIEKWRSFAMSQDVGSYFSAWSAVMTCSDELASAILADSAPTVPDSPGLWWRDDLDDPVRTRAWVDGMVWSGGKVVDDGHWMGPCRKPVKP